MECFADETFKEMEKNKTKTTPQKTFSNMRINYKPGKI